jgi:hypothetical protein
MGWQRDHHDALATLFQVSGMKTHALGIAAATEISAVASGN